MGYTLTKSDKEILLKIGYKENNLKQIQDAIDVSTFSLYEAGTYNKETVISAEEAYELLGQGVFLSGISRSAFHWSSVREVPDTDDLYRIMFESDALFTDRPHVTKDYKGEDKVTVAHVLLMQEEKREEIER